MFRPTGQLPTVRGMLARLVLVCVVPALVACAALLLVQYQQRAEQTRENTRQTVRAMRQALDHQIAQARSLAQYLASSEALHQGDLNRFYREASSLVSTSHVASNVALVARDGRQLLNTAVPLGTALPSMPAESATMRAFASDGPVLTDLLRGAVVKRPVVGMLVPVRVQGDTPWVVAVSMHAQLFQDLLAAQRLPEGWIAAVADGSGVMVARSRGADQFVGLPVAEALRRSMAMEAEGVIEATSKEGIPMLAFHSRALDSRWQMVVGISRDALSADVRQSVIRFAIAMLAICLAALVWARALAIRLASSFEDLLAPAEALGRAEEPALPSSSVAEAAALRCAIARAGQLLREREERLLEQLAATERAHLALEEHRGLLERTVEQRTQELENARSAAEQANRAKSVFLANMSHEVRTPLNAILGVSHLLASQEGSARQRKWLGKIEDAARHLLTVVDDVLDLAKIDAGRLQLEDRVFSVMALLDSVKSIVGSEATAKRLHVLTQQQGVSAWLRGDESRLRQALLDYAGNAVKFTSAGEVQVRAVLLERAGDRELVRFSVTDTGQGIAADDLGRLFQAFEQADAGTSRRHGGTGLGLSITLRLAS